MAALRRTDRTPAGSPRRARPVRRALLAATCAVLVFLPTTLHAHLGLRSSEPANGATLRVVPLRLRLDFTERVEVALARVRLIGPGGDTLSLGPAGTDSATLVVVPIEDALRAGSYTVLWQVTGADGHPVRGEYRFSVAADAVGLPPDPAAALPEPMPGATEHHDPSVFPEGPGFGVESPAYVAIRWLAFAAILGLIGAVAFRGVVLPLAGRSDAAAIEDLPDSAAEGARRIGILSAGSLGVVTVLRLGAQSFALHGPAGAADPDLLAATVLRTTWGHGWIVQVVAVAAALGGLALAARRTGSAGWVIASIAAAGSAFGLAMSGHAASVRDVRWIAVVMDAAHVLAAGAWIGGLLVVVAVGLPAAVRLPAARRGPAVATLVNAFSPAALAFAAIVVSTGAFAAWLHLGGVAALWQSAYGRTLLLKLGVLSTVFATGAHNWLRVKPILGGEVGTDRLRRTATLEIAVGVLVLLVTAILVATPPP